MTIEQTVEIPANHRLVIDVPPYIPKGKATISFSIAPAHSNEGSQSAKTWRAFRGMFKGSGGTVADFLKRTRTDRDLEDEIDKRHQDPRGI
jgi:cytidylate kinase